MVAGKVFIVRHGERIDRVDKNWKERVDNPDDPFLSERGLAQAGCLGARLADEGIVKIFVSPFYRTMQTAAAVAAATSARMHIEPGICEGLRTKWFPQGKPQIRNMTDLAKEFPAVDPTYVPVELPVYPETKMDTRVRVMRAVKKIVEREDGNILLVGHRGSCDGSARALLGLDDIPWMNYCAITELHKIVGSTPVRYEWGGTRGPDISYMSEDVRLFLSFRAVDHKERPVGFIHQISLKEPRHKKTPPSDR